MNEYSITLFEACEILNRSKKTVSRYVRRGRLTPQKITSQQGTLEYRFSRADLDALRLELDREAQEQARQTTGDQTGQTRRDTTGETGHGRQDIVPPFETENPLNPPQETEKDPKTEETGQTRQDTEGRQDRPDRTGQSGHYEEIITLLKETTGLLKEQLTVKDSQIGTLNDQVQQLIERDRETNVLLKGMQDRLIALEPHKQEAIETTSTISKAEPEQATETPRSGAIPRNRGERVRHVILFAVFLIVLGVYFYYNVLPTIQELLRYGKW